VPFSDDSGPSSKSSDSLTARNRLGNKEKEEVDVRRWIQLFDIAQTGSPKRCASDLSVISGWFSSCSTKTCRCWHLEGAAFTQMSNTINFRINSLGKLTFGYLGEFCSLRAMTTELLHV